MIALDLLDILLVVILLAYFIYGYRIGLLASLGGIVGIAAGAVAAFFAIPFVSSWVADSAWRVPVILIVVFGLLAVGQGFGLALGRAISQRVGRGNPLRIVDRICGALLDFVVAALVMSTLAFSIGSLGVPFISQALSSSGVIRTIDSLTPSGVQSLLAQVRSLAVQDGLPRIVDNLRPGTTGAVPTIGTNSAALNTAAQSVVKIVGTAYQCGQNQTGSGFVVAQNRIVTNAHVVAGVNQPVVQAQDGSSRRGRVVYFDPQNDLAVIAVAGLKEPPLVLRSNLQTGDDAIFDGYPLGGPFQANPASVQTVATVQIADIYGQNDKPREVYYLNANVQPGNSGGPLLSTSGQVAGVVFAKATDSRPVGYALTMSELRPVAAKAASLSASVDPGECTKGG